MFACEENPEAGRPSTYDPTGKVFRDNTSTHTLPKDFDTGDQGQILEHDSGPEDLCRTEF